MTNFANKKQFDRLVNKYLEGKATQQEIVLLEKYYDYFDKEQNITDQLSSTEKEILEKEMLATIWKKSANTVRVVKLYKRPWLRFAAAAILLLVTGGVLLLLKLETSHQQSANHQQLVNDIAPGGNKAVLTLADGSTIILDNTAIGAITQQGNSKVLKLDDGKLSYSSVNDSSTALSTTEILYNTITTPRGGQYQLILADGSKVWLNAASSLRFPANFVGNERRVELTGEAYFEVVKKPAMPFKVNVASKGEVEVLGTYFNINSYANETNINTTLLEGSVKMSGLKPQDFKLITPGQQAQLTVNGHINVNKQVDLSEVMAWKNGKFIFQDADIKSIMRQIERWYDVDVSYSGNVNNEQFVGLIPRSVNISQILKMLEKTGTVKFEIHGRRVIVK